MNIKNHEGLQEEATNKEIADIVRVLSGLCETLLNDADYLELRGVLTQKEIRQLDSVRIMIAGKVLQITQ